MTLLLLYAAVPAAVAQCTCRLCVCGYVGRKGWGEHEYEGEAGARASSEGATYRHMGGSHMFEWANQGSTVNILVALCAVSFTREGERKRRKMGQRDMTRLSRKVESNAKNSNGYAIQSIE
eukprot:GDKI01049765.1.p1 GENE.GDKI01049765.1~~GDKI01049765.1.p1  ORF type:complete len:121 (+),score=20.02 GDKI01049765.1:93-455(+)